MFPARPFFTALFVFGVWLFHGLLFGPSDDEAYYWALAQEFRLGFAYHPPGVLWAIGFFDWFFGWFGDNEFLRVAALRFPSSLFTAGIVFFLHLLAEKRSGGAAPPFLILAVPGIFGVSWMMVPDLPLLLGIVVLIWAIDDDRPRWFGLALGSMLCLLGKFSGILPIASAGLALLLQRRFKEVIPLVVGAVLGGMPTLWFNLSEGYQSFQYHLGGRHSGEFSFLRWLKFLGSQVLIVGPLFFFAIIRLFDFLRWRELDGFEKTIWLFVLPPFAIYFFQPFIGDFKPHWTFVAWIPMMLFLTESTPMWKRLQMIYGIPVLLIVMASCHLPIIGLVNSAGGKTPNPLHDVTNDLYGWSKFGAWYRADGNNLPVIGGRYQTTSQAAFAVGTTEGFARIPRPKREYAEWHEPALNVFFYVADNRYRGGPNFPNVKCRDSRIFETQRWGLLAKEIHVLRCEKD